MTREREHKKEEISQDLEEYRDEIQQKVDNLGLNPRPVRYWINHNDEVNQLAAYGGFTERYPHWRWGMKYDRQQKEGEYGGGKIFEMVINDDPCHAYLQMSNKLVDQKAVIAHVEAHSDFFANNEWFQDSPNAVDMLARHAEKIEQYMEDPDIEREEVERWIDHILCLEDNIDQYSEYIFRQNVDVDGKESGEEKRSLEQLGISKSIREEVFDDGEEVKEEAPHPVENTTKDILGFLISEGKQYDEERKTAVEYEEWQLDILDMLREEAYYFAPQKMTKTINEGHACVEPDTRIFTSEGLIPMREVINGTPSVSDGHNERSVTDTHIIEDRDIVEITTRKGYNIAGSSDHRILTPDGWKEMQEFDIGDVVGVSGGNALWPSEKEKIEYNINKSATLQDVADEASYSVGQVHEYRKDDERQISDEAEGKIATAMKKLDYDKSSSLSASASQEATIPDVVDEEFAKFLGMLIADGYMKKNGGRINFTYGDEETVREWGRIGEESFGISANYKEDGRGGERWRCNFNSVKVKQFLYDELDICQGKSSGRKTIPEKILRSPKNIVSEFLSALVGCDGYAGENGIVYITKSEEMSEQVQTILTNYGIISNRSQQDDGCWRIHITGKSANRFSTYIGLSDENKQERLDDYVNSLSWFEHEEWVDEIVDIQNRNGTVYDITVEDTHQYAGAGFINHNSYWESMVMADEEYADVDEIIDYADQHSRVIQSSQFNPYRLGKKLWEYIENSVNRREVVDKLLRVEDVTPDNFHREIDFDAVHEQLTHSDSDDIVKRNYSLSRLHNKGFIKNINLDELRKMNRYIVNRERYEKVSEALKEVDYERGWNRMREVRETHNDVMFIDEFMTQEFVDEEDYFTYEYRVPHERHEIASRDVEDVKKKLLLQFTNFGKPTVEVADNNYDNSGELLLLHRYNGIVMDMQKLQGVMERLFEMWGRPVNIVTVGKFIQDEELDFAYSEDVEPEPIEKIVRIKYDGSEFSEYDVGDERIKEAVKADEIDYQTIPKEWK